MNCKGFNSLRPFLRNITDEDMETLFTRYHIADAQQGVVN